MALDTFFPNLPGGDFAQEIGLFSPLVLGWLFPLHSFVVFIGVAVAFLVLRLSVQ